MAKYDNLSSANTLAQHATSDRDQLLVHLFTEMAQKISYLEQQVNEFGQWRNNADTTAIRLNEFEAGLGKLTDLTAGGLLDPFDERVLQVLNVRSGTAFEHIEGEIEDKLADFTDTLCFTDAVDEAVREGLSRAVEEALEGILHDAIIDAIGDAEDIVRKGLRSIL